MPVRPALPLCYVLLLFGRGAASAAEEPLTTVAAARALPVSAAAAGRPVQLSGVIGYLRHTDHDLNFSLHDATGGVMVYPVKGPDLQPGQAVTVTGTTNVMLHGLEIFKARVTPGEMHALPSARPATLAEIIDGKYEDEFVELEGIVREVRLEDPRISPRRLALDLGSRRHRLTAWITTYDPQHIALEAGETIRVRGVVLRWTNTRGQPQSANLLVNTLADVSALAVPGELPAEPLRELLLWNGASSSATRTRTEGTVTFHQPGGLTVIQEDDFALRVFPVDPGALPETPPETLRPGDRVEVTGFPALGEYTVELEDARWHRLGPGPLPAPLSFASAEAVIGRGALVDRDARLISLRGTVRAIREQEERLLLEMESGRTVFNAWLPAGTILAKDVRPGSVVQLEGICTLHLRDTLRRLGRRPEQFSLQLMGPESVRILRAAPWWNAARLFQALGAVAGVCLLLALWAGSLRQRNRRLREEMRARARAERDLAGERQRVAGELHDTLEQTLLATALQLHAASRTLALQPAAIAAPLSLAHQLVERSRQEVRAAVWDLHLGEAPPEPLSVLLARVCAESSSDHAAEVSFAAEGPARPLPALVTIQTLRLVREAIANALKHAAPRHIRVRLRTDATHLHCTVSDDGHGFDPAAAPGPDTGHFGLSGMEERAGRLGGTLRLNSAPGHGATLEFQLPLTRA